MASLILACLLWAFSFGLIKDRLTGYDPNLVAALRLAVAALAFAPWLSRGRAAPRDRLALILLGALQFGLMYILYIASFRWLPAWGVAVLTVFTPLYVAWIEGALARRIRPAAWGASALAVLGAGVIAWHGSLGPDIWRGVVLLQSANLCFAAGQVLYRRRSDGLDDAPAMAWMYLGAATLAGLAFALRPSVEIGDWDRAAAATVLYLGLLPTAVGFWLWNRGVRATSVGVGAVLNNFKIPSAVAVSWLVFGERSDPWRLLLGLTLVVLATTWAGRAESSWFSRN